MFTKFNLFKANLSTISELTNETYGDVSNHGGERHSTIHMQQQQQQNQQQQPAYNNPGATSLLSPSACMLIDPDETATSGGNFFTANHQQATAEPLTIQHQGVTMRRGDPRSNSSPDNQQTAPAALTNNGEHLKSVIASLISNASEIQIELVDENDESQGTLQGKFRFTY
jgi:hypothetical protein